MNWEVRRLVMNNGNFKRKDFIKKSYKNGTWKLVPRTFVFLKNNAQPLLKNDIFETRWLYWIHKSKTIKNIKISKQTSSDSFLQNTI